MAKRFVQFLDWVDRLFESRQPECFQRLAKYANERKPDYARAMRAAAWRKAADEKYDYVTRKVLSHEGVMRSFCAVLWGTHSSKRAPFSVYRSPDCNEWVLEGMNAQSQREVIVVEVLSPDNYQELFGAKEPYEPFVYVHWHERRYTPVKVQSLCKDDFAEALVTAVERGGPFRVKRVYYTHWVCRS